MRTRAVGLVLLLMAGLLGLPRVATAQTPAELLVVVRAEGTAELLRNAQVSVVELGTGGLTDAQGEFRRGGLLPGLVTVEISSVGYGTVRTQVRLQGGATAMLQVTLGVAPVEQAPIEVRSRRGDTRTLQEYYSRLDRGGSAGHIIPRERIESLRPRQFSDLLRDIPNLRLDCSNWQHCSLSMRQVPVTGVTGDCPVQFYVNGIYQPYPDVNLLDPDHIEGVEVYPHAHGAPARYLMRKNARCGIVLVWLRRSW
jgi:hypothetical protein